MESERPEQHESIDERQFVQQHDQLLNSSSESKEGVRSAEDILYERWKDWMEMQFKEPDTSFEVFKDDTSWMFFIPAFEKYANQFKTSQFTPTAIDVKEIEEVLNNVWVSQCEKFKHDVNSVVISRTMAFEMLKEALQSRVVNVSDAFDAGENACLDNIEAPHGEYRGLMNESKSKFLESCSKLSLQSEKEIKTDLGIEYLKEKFKAYLEWTDNKNIDFETLDDFLRYLRKTDRTFSQRGFDSYKKYSEKEMDEKLQQLLQNILKHSTDDFSYVDSESVTVSDIKNEFSKLGVTVDDKTNF